MSVPVAPADRVEALDVLRGVALFGVLTVNLVTIFRLSLFQEFLQGPEDAWARAVALGLEFKAVTLFSLLFGIGRRRRRSIELPSYSCADSFPLGHRSRAFVPRVERRCLTLYASAVSSSRRCSGYRPALSWGSICSSRCRSPSAYPRLCDGS